ncbi:MAG: hypothetical protein KY456_11735 [Chloroflexi bacterium]|nr:hypothetical protein [Chloroflexota bacterium]
MFASEGEITSGDGLPAEPQDIVEDDVLVPVLDRERMLATSASADYVLSLGSGLPAADWLPQRLDRIAEDVIAAHALSRQRDDDAATARQSA